MMLPRKLSMREIAIEAVVSFAVYGGIGYLVGGWSFAAISIWLGSQISSQSRQIRGAEEEIHRLQVRILELETSTALSGWVARELERTQSEIDRLHNCYFEFEEQQFKRASSSDDTFDKRIKTLDDRLFELEIERVTSDRINYIEQQIEKLWDHSLERQ